jgi:hypothetical protein
MMKEENSFVIVCDIQHQYNILYRNYKLKILMNELTQYKKWNLIYTKIILNNLVIKIKTIRLYNLLSNELNANVSDPTLLRFNKIPFLVRNLPKKCLFDNVSEITLDSTIENISIRTSENILENIQEIEQKKEEIHSNMGDDDHIIEIKPLGILFNVDISNNKRKIIPDIFSNSRNNVSIDMNEDIIDCTKSTEHHPHQFVDNYTSSCCIYFSYVCKLLQYYCNKCRLFITNLFDKK